MFGFAVPVRATLAILVALIALSCRTTHRVPTSMPADLVITGATLIDGTGAPPRLGITIAIRNGRIAAVAPDGEIEIDARAKVIAAAGKHVIPGLADMHVHFGRGGGLPNNPQSVERVLRQFLSYGVTTVLNLGAYSGRPDEIVDLRRRQLAGEMLAPHIYATGGADGAREPPDQPMGKESARGRRCCDLRLV